MDQFEKSVIQPTPNSEPAHQRVKKIRAPQKKIFQRLDFIEGSTGFHSGPQKRSGFKLALWTWLSAGIDTLVLLSMSFFCMILFSFFMQTSARKVFLSLIQQPSLANIFVGSFLVSYWLYLITMRLFIGASVGEWTCELRLGQPVQRNQARYILQVMARTSIVLMTGIIIVPILSLFFKRDLAGDITGIKIYSLK